MVSVTWLLLTFFQNDMKYFSRPTSIVIIIFLEQVFSRFVVPDNIVSYNGMQFTYSDFQNLCKYYEVENITMPTYHRRSNGQAECLVHMFKMALKKLNWKETEVIFQQFLRINNLSPKTNTASRMSLAELMFTRKSKLLFDKLLPWKKIKSWHSMNLTIKFFKAGEKVFFRFYKAGKEIWEDGEIVNCISRMMYMVQGQNCHHKKQSENMTMK